MTRRLASARRIALILIALPCAAILSGSWRMAHAEKPAMDRISRPAPIRHFVSPAGTCELSVSSADNWKTPYGVAALTRIGDKAQRVEWRTPLPHYRGPRTAVVTDAGDAVLVDEWVNSPSRHAVTVISAAGKILAEYSFDQLVALLGVERRQISAHARLGTWMSAEPVLAPDQTSIGFSVAGRHLQLQLADGRLAASD